MVLKRSKCGLNSGCTIKFGKYQWESKYNAAKVGVVVKTFRNSHIQPVNFEFLNRCVLEESKRCIDDGGMEALVEYNRGRYIMRRERLMYSLNKLKRWTLVESVGREIEELAASEPPAENEKNYRFTMTLVERKIEHLEHLTHCRSHGDVAAYHDSSLPNPHVYPRAIYSYHTDLRQKGKTTLNNPTAKSKRIENHNQKFRNDHQRPRVRSSLPPAEEEEEIVQEKIPEISYEICTPKSTFSAHPKHNKTSKWDRWDWRPWSKKAEKKQKSVKNKRYTMREMGYTHKEMSRLHETARRDLLLLEEDFEDAAVEDQGNNDNVMTSTNAALSDSLEDCLMDSDRSEECLVDLDCSGEYIVTECEHERVMNVELEEALGKATNRPYKNNMSAILSDQPRLGLGMDLKGKGKAIYTDDLDFWDEFPVEKVIRARDVVEENVVESNQGSNQDSEISFPPTSSTELDSLYSAIRDVPPLVCLVTADSVHPKMLERSYGELYVEGMCLPRRFAVRLGGGEGEEGEGDRGRRRGGEGEGEEGGRIGEFEDVARREIEKREATIGLHAEDCFLVIQILTKQPEDEEEEEEEEEIINPNTRHGASSVMANTALTVSVRLRCQLPGEQVSAINGKVSGELASGVAHSMERVLRAFHRCLLLLNNRSSSDNPSRFDHPPPLPHPPTRPHKAPTVLFSNLSSLNSWRVDCFTGEEAAEALREERLVLPHTKPLRKLHSHSAVVSNYPGSKQLLCDICFDPIRENGHVTGSAMTSCDHWFCDTCWSCHLVERIQRGDLVLSCPGYECDTAVDTASLLSLLPYTYYLKHQAHLTDAKLEQSAQWQWCRKPKCGNALHANILPRSQGSKVITEVNAMVKCQGRLKNTNAPTSQGSSEKHDVEDQRLKNNNTLNMIGQERTRELSTEVREDNVEGQHRLRNENTPNSNQHLGESSQGSSSSQVQGKVAAISEAWRGSGQGMCVQCVCEASWCWDCDREPHWPAPCDRALTYTKLLKQRGDDAAESRREAVYFAAVKRCPACRHPMEKDGGCQHMTCRCGHSFCWECLKPWTNHDWDLCIVTGKKEETIELDDHYTRVGAWREEYYRLAVRHRRARILLLRPHPLIPRGPALTDDQRGLLYECHFVLEWSFAMLSTCTYRQIRNSGVRTQLGTLSFLLDCAYGGFTPVASLWTAGHGILRSVGARLRRLQQHLLETDAHTRD